VGAPGSIAHLITIEGIDGNATIDNRNEIRVGQRVKYSSGPRPVNAGEDQVVIEREPQALWFADGPVGNLNVASNCSGCLRCFPAGNVDLGPLQVRVA